MSIRQYQKFTTDDEDTLINMVNDQLKKSTRINWKPIAATLSKTPRQCYDFYIIRKQSSNKTEKHDWQLEEISQLLDAVQTHGTKWDTIKTEYFPNLTQNQLRNKYYHTTKSSRANSSQNLAQGIGSSVEINQRTLSLNDFFNAQFTQQNNMIYTTQSTVPENLDVFGENVNDMWDDEY
ncbi:Myb-like DNA-binding domain-containing protein [Spironucleus salmonicida]|uniref:Myb-like DNA-binding domain-containing protein n=1 Tax=Spironucleus salmonicida TaxID=348837 RepID=V6LKP8_9EUKA|nr:Myb-like DNA-binding domain-containing protein [Spironucleus salmonicida]|eukprot:EST45195.1 Myb-like DNA-binding domain-containing protein [Spironucleus salmonicida]